MQPIEKAPGAIHSHLAPYCCMYHLRSRQRVWNLPGFASDLLVSSVSFSLILSLGDGGLVVVEEETALSLLVFLTVSTFFFMKIFKRILASSFFVRRRHDANLSLSLGLDKFIQGDSTCTKLTCPTILLF